MTYAAYRWLLSDDFSSAINQYRREHVILSEGLLKDENVSRWYEVKGTWLEGSLPYYADKDR